MHLVFYCSFGFKNLCVLSNAKKDNASKLMLCQTPVINCRTFYCTRRGFFSDRNTKFITSGLSPPDLHLDSPPTPPPGLSCVLFYRLLQLQWACAIYLSNLSLNGLNRVKRGKFFPLHDSRWTVSPQASSENVCVPILQADYSPTHSSSRTVVS